LRFALVALEKSGQALLRRHVVRIRIAGKVTIACRDYLARLWLVIARHRRGFVWLRPYRTLSSRTSNVGLAGPAIAATVVAPG